MTTNNLHGHSTFVNIDCFNAHLSCVQFDIQLFCRKWHMQLVVCRHNARWSKPEIVFNAYHYREKTNISRKFFYVNSFLSHQKHLNKSHNAAFSQNISIPN